MMKGLAGSHPTNCSLGFAVASYVLLKAYAVLCAVHDCRVGMYLVSGRSSVCLSPCSYDKGTSLPIEALVLHAVAFTQLLEGTNMLYCQCMLPIAHVRKITILQQMRAKNSDWLL